MKRVAAIVGLLILATGPLFLAMAQTQAGPKDKAAPDKTAATHSSATSSTNTDRADEAALRIEGEKRFRTNCGRCHMPPHKFPPRVMATAIRHMRVRAMLTEEDMRLILKYMTQ